MRVSGKGPFVFRAIRKLGIAVHRWAEHRIESRRMPARDLHGLPPEARLPEMIPDASVAQFFDRLSLSDAERFYLGVHMRRYRETLSLIQAHLPAGGKILDIGCYPFFAAAVQHFCRATVTGIYRGSMKGRDSKIVESADGRWEIPVDVLDAERDAFPYENGTFDLAMCCEVIEHMLADPVHMLLEARRVLKPGGSVLVTTPNCVSISSLKHALIGLEHPYIHPPYAKPGVRGEWEPPHVREYTPAELHSLLIAAGFKVIAMTTVKAPWSELDWLDGWLDIRGAMREYRGEQIYAVASVEVDAAINRYPRFLYLQ